MNAQLETQSALPRFTKIGADGAAVPDDATEWVAVADIRSGLMWAREPIAVDDWQPKTAEKVAAQLGNLGLAGFNDWRVPTVEELFPLADRAKYSPAIDETFFPGCPSDWFWTKTPYAPDGDYAWLVLFLNGGAYALHRYLNGFVRAVRGGQ